MPFRAAPDPLWMSQFAESLQQLDPSFSIAQALDAAARAWSATFMMKPDQAAVQFLAAACRVRRVP